MQREKSNIDFFTANAHSELKSIGLFIRNAFVVACSIYVSIVVYANGQPLEVILPGLWTFEIKVYNFILGSVTILVILLVCPLFITLRAQRKEIERLENQHRSTVAKLNSTMDAISDLRIEVPLSKVVENDSWGVHTPVRKQARLPVAVLGLDDQATPRNRRRLFTDF